MLPAIHGLSISQKTIALVVAHFVLQPMGNGHGSKIWGSLVWIEFIQ